MAERLEDRDTVLQLAMRGGRMGSWSRDYARDMVEWSVELEALFGLPPGSFGRSREAFLRLVHPQDRSKVDAAINRSAQRRSDYTVEFRFRHASGEWRWMEARGTVLFGESGRPLRSYGVAMDITERKRVEAALHEREAQLRAAAAEREQLLESERTARVQAERLSHVKDEFLATLSHELRTPLNAIQGWSILLRAPNMTEAERLRGLETIERNTRAQAQIINDLLDMSRIVSGKIHLELQSLRLPDMISAAIEAIRPSAEAKRIHVRTLIASEIAPWRGDPNRLQQVLWNLLTNAVKFTPAGGRVEVRLARADGQIEIEVADTGIGIKAEFLPHVFDRFRQADPSTTRQYGGLGLGLSIVRSLVELHGGSVQVHSAGENRGCTFSVSLPMSVADREDTGRFRLFEPLPERAEAPELAELPRLDGVTALIVDDEADARDLVSRILEGHGARPVCVADAAAALETLERERIDVMLSDIGMPEVDGYELMRRAREHESKRGAPMPAIAVTAYARPEDRQRSLLAGFQMNIAKPIEPRELVAGIASLLKLAR